MGLHISSRWLPLMTLRWPPDDSQGNWGSDLPKISQPQVGKLGFKLIPFSFHGVNLFSTCLMCVLRGFCGNEVGEGGTQDSGGAREPGWEDVNGSTSLRWDGFEIINLIRESVAAPELQCIITISTLVFAKCHLYPSSPVYPQWTMSLLRQQLLIHIVTIMISQVFPDHTSADVIQSSSLPCSHTLSHTLRHSALYDIFAT